ncbi:hypothetical protein QVD17_30121 [Tagetes erecta]|uniref:Uncharacterized protein n=1 Tax=Tagetes erecta TaxID=13708 RepID=A0AAD8NMR3_TARER|nr:hypothetical protein QVD17_30121 [Tagetes erecta]
MSSNYGSGGFGGGGSKDDDRNKNDVKAYHGFGEFRKKDVGRLKEKKGIADKPLSVTSDGSYVGDGNRSDGGGPYGGYGDDDGGLNCGSGYDDVEESKVEDEANVEDTSYPGKEDGQDSLSFMAWVKSALMTFSEDMLIWQSQSESLCSYAFI